MISPFSTAGARFWSVNDAPAAVHRRGWWLNQTSPALSDPGRRMGGAPFSALDPPGSN